MSFYAKLLSFFLFRRTLCAIFSDWAMDSSILIRFNRLATIWPVKRHISCTTGRIATTTMICQARSLFDKLLLRTRWHILSEVSPNQHPFYLWRQIVPLTWLNSQKCRHDRTVLICPFRSRARREEMPERERRVEFKFDFWEYAVRISIDLETHLFFLL